MALMNRREYYRAQLTIPVKWRVLLAEEVRAVRQGLGKDLFRSGRMPGPIDEFLQQAAPGSKDEQLYRALQLISNKLDFLIEQTFIRTDQPAPSRGEVIDISGSGLKFTCHDHVPMGSLLKLDLVMPATSQYQLEMICDVVRSETQLDGYIVACKILEIDESARESIVNVVFQRQRQEIRNSKGGREDPNAY